MAFGLSPKYIHEFKLDDISKEHLLVLAWEASLQLGWDVSFLSDSGFIAYTKVSMTSWSEQITIEITGDTATIKSECTGAQLFDWGKNKRNAKKLLVKIDEVKNILSDEEVLSKFENIRQVFSSDESQSPLSVKEKLTGFSSVFKLSLIHI